MLNRVRGHFPSQSRCQSSMLRACLLVIVVFMLEAASMVDAAAPLCIWGLLQPSTNMSTIRINVTSVAHARATPSVARRYFLQQGDQRPLLHFSIIHDSPAAVQVLFGANSNNGGANVTSATGSTQSAAWGRVQNPSDCRDVEEGRFFSLDDASVVALSARDGSNESPFSTIAVVHNPVVAAGLCVAADSALSALTGDRASGMLFIEANESTVGASASFSTIPILSSGFSRKNNLSVAASNSSRTFTWVSNESFSGSSLTYPVEVLQWNAQVAHSSPQAASRVQLSPAALNASTAATDTLICSVGDSISLDMKVLPVGTPLLDAIAGYCYIFGTVSELHHACEGNELCIGYTTNFVDSNDESLTASPDDATAELCYKEVPLCMLFSGQANADEWSWVYRVLYLKPQRQSGDMTKRLSCESPIDLQLPSETSLFLEVWISQTHMQSGSADVFLDGAYVTRCGGADWPFASGGLGLDRHCDSLFLCASVNLSSLPRAVPVPVNVSVVYHASTPFFPSVGCSETFSSVVHVSHSTQSAAVFAPPALPVPSSARESFDLVSALVDADVLSSSSVWVSMDTLESSVFMFEVDAVVVEVQQGGMGLDVLGNFSWYVRELGSRGSATPLAAQPQHCSSNRGLVSGSSATAAGLSHQCDALFACGGVVNVSAADNTSFTGILELAVSAGMLSASVDACGGLLMRITALRRRRATVASVVSSEPFVLGSVTRGFTPLIGLRPGNWSGSLNTTNNASSIVRQEVLESYFSWNIVPPVERESILASFAGTDIVVPGGFSGVPLMWATAPWGAAEGRLQWLNPNVSYALFVDQAQSTAVSFFYIPTRAVSLSIDTTPSLLSADAAVSVMIWAGYSVLDVIRCAQDVDFIAHPAVSCILSACMRGYLLPTGADSITVVVDTASLGTNPVCNFGLSVVLNFTDVNTAAASIPSTSCWLCPATRQCIDPSEVCDGIAQCDGGADEALCDRWRLLELGRVLLTEAATNPLYDSSVLQLPSAATLGACLHQALQNDRNTVIYNTSLCVAYCVSQNSMRDPSASLISVANVSMYAALPAAANAEWWYGSCTDAYRCSNHGVAVSSASLSASGRGHCRCVCNASLQFEGNWCDTVAGIGSSTSTGGILQTILSFPLLPQSGTNTTLLSTDLPLFPTGVSCSGLQLVVRTALSAVDALYKTVSSCSTLGLASASTSPTQPVVVFLCTMQLDNASMATRRSLLASFESSLEAQTATMNPTTNSTRYDSATYLPMFISSDSPMIVASPTVALLGDTLHISPFGNCTLIPLDNASHLQVLCTNRVAPMIVPVESPRALRVVITADVRVTAIRVTVHGGGQSGLENVSANCGVLHDSSGAGGCNSAVCLIESHDVLAMIANSSGLVLDADLALSDSASLFSEQWCALRATEPIQVDVLHSPVLPSSSRASGRGAVLETTDPSFRTPLIIVGIVILVLSAAAIIVGITLLVFDARDAARLHEEASTEATKVTRLLHEGFARLQWYVRTPHRFRSEHWGLVSSVVGYNVACIAIVLLLVAYNSPDHSTYRVSIESFGDQLCGLSTLGNVPRSQLVVDPSELCTSDGSSVGRGGFGRRAVFATCSFVDGDWWALISYGATVGDCNGIDRNWAKTVDGVLENSQHEIVGVESGRMWVRNGSCVASPPFFMDAYISVLCGDTNSIVSRHAVLQQALGSRVPPLVGASATIRPAPTLNPLSLDLDAAVRAIGALPSYFAKDTKVRLSTSFTDEFFAAVAASSVGEQAEEWLPTLSRLVYQSAATFTSEPSGMPSEPALTSALSVPSLSIPLAQPSAGLSPYLPKPDTLGWNAPLGFAFHTQTSSSTTPPVQALFGDQRYYRLEESAADIGYFFGPETTEDDYGFTISFYGRFDASAEGFVFIATDALEEYDPASGRLRSPIIDAASVMESQLLSEDEWFESPFRVYYGLYVSATTNRMHFIMADPVRAKESMFDVSGNSSRYARSMFALEALGAGGGTLFNGEWHYVAVVLRNENGDVKAQLVVDGFYDRGQTQCLPRRPTPVSTSNWQAGSPMSAVRPTSAVAFSSGALYVGAFQGSVASLRFEPTAVPLLSLITRGTPAARRLHDLHRDEIYSIAVALIVISVILTLFTVCSSGYAVSVDSGKAESSDEANAVAVFVRVTRYEVEEDHPSGGRTFKQRYPRPSFAMCKRWLGLTQSQLTLFMEELQQTCKYPHRELLRTMYLIRHADRHKTVPPNTAMELPSYEAWKELVQYDMKHPKPAKKEFFWQTTTTGQIDDKLHPLEFAVQNKGGNTLSEAAYVASREAAERLRKDQQKHGDDQDDLGQDAAEANLRTAGAQYVDTGGGIGNARGGMGGASSSSRAVGGQGANSMTHELYQFFLPVITSLQTVYVWMSTISFPGDYGAIFGEFFSAMAIDIAQVVHALSAYATPLMQLLAGLIVVGGLYYLCAVDNKMFEWYLARYTLRRDQLERRPAKPRRKSALDLLEASHRTSNLSTTKSPLIPPPAAHDGPAESEPDHGIKILRPTSDDGQPVDKAQRRFSTITKPFRYAHSLVSSSYIDEFPDPFDDTVSSDLSYAVAIMPLTECQKIDRFCIEDDLPVFLQKEVRDVIEVVDDEGTVISLSRNACEGSVPWKEPHDYSDVQGHAYVQLSKDHAPTDAPLPPQISREHNPATELHVRLVSDGSEKAPDAPPTVLTSKLEVVGCFCRRHPYQRLSPLLQTIVWPFEDPPACCVVRNGVRCGQRSGLVYRCGLKKRTVDGAPYSCDYAICERHFRGTLKDVLLAQLAAIVRLVKDRGWNWALAVVFVTLGNAAYTPFMKTALMIVSCNPYFECVFACWEAPDTTFVVAAFLCIVMLVAFGLGVPAIQVSLLRFRRHQLETVFLSSEYAGQYTAVEEPTPRLERMGLSEFAFGIFTGNSVAPLIDFFKRRAQSTTEALMVGAEGAEDDATPQNNGGPTTKPPHEDDEEEESKDVHIEANPTVSLSEWSRFLATDPTAMAMLYNTMELRFMHLSPILLLWKVLMISQVVFLEQGSIGQRRGMAVVEVLFAALIFITAPFTSPVVDAMYRLASIHQLLLLGLQNLDTVYLIDGEDSISLFMIGVSVLYLLICGIVICVTMVWPAVVSVRDKQQSRELLLSLGFQFSGTTTLYVTPVVGRGVRVEERESFRSVAGQALHTHEVGEGDHVDANLLLESDNNREDDIAEEQQPVAEVEAPIGSVPP